MSHPSDVLLAISPSISQLLHAHSALCKCGCGTLGCLCAWTHLLVYILGHIRTVSLVQRQAHVLHLSHLVCLIMHSFGGFCGGLDSFDATALRMSPAEAAATDPQQRVLLELALLALADADSIPNPPTGKSPAVHDAKTAVKHLSATAKRNYHTHTQASPCVGATLRAWAACGVLTATCGVIDTLQLLGTDLQVTLVMAVQVCTLAACTTSTSACRRVRAPRSCRRPSSATGRRTWLAA